MSIVDVRVAFRENILDPLVGTWLGEALAYPPDGVGATPLAYLGDAVAVVTTGMSDEIWAWTLPLTVLVTRTAVYGSELAVVEAVLDALLAQIRANFTLAGLTMGLRFTDVREGQIRIADVPYVGLTIVFHVKPQKIPVSYTG